MPSRLTDDVETEVTVEVEIDVTVVVDVGIERQLHAASKGMPADDSTGGTGRAGFSARF